MIGYRLTIGGQKILKRTRILLSKKLFCFNLLFKKYLFRYNRGGGGYNNRNQGFNNRNNHGGYNRNHNPNNLNRSLPSNQAGSGKSDSRLNQSDIEPVSGSFKKTPKKEEPVKVPTSLVNYEGSDDEDEDGLKECYYYIHFIFIDSLLRALHL